MGQVICCLGIFTCLHQGGLKETFLWRKRESGFYFNHVEYQIKTSLDEHTCDVAYVLMWFGIWQENRFVSWHSVNSYWSRQELTGSYMKQ